MAEIYNALPMPRSAARPAEGIRAGPHPALTGPRQVGKTTLLLEIAGQVRRQSCVCRRRRSRCRAAGFWERCWADAETRAQRETAVLLLDEVHHLSDWLGGLRAIGRARRVIFPFMS